MVSGRETTMQEKDEKGCALCTCHTTHRLPRLCKSRPARIQKQKRMKFHAGNQRRWLGEEECDTGMVAVSTRILPSTLDGHSPLIYRLSDSSAKTVTCSPSAGMSTSAEMSVDWYKMMRHIQAWKERYLKEWWKKTKYRPQEKNREVTKRDSPVSDAPPFSRPHSLK